MTAAKVIDAPRQTTQPGKGLGHYCATHATDAGCCAEPNACRGWCGYRFNPTRPSFDTGWVLPGCVVCDEMEAARVGRAA